MDVQLPAAKSRRVRRNVQVGAVVLALAVLTVVAAQLAGRPPSISGDELWTARVTQGEFVHEIAGTGTLVAPEIRSITNRSDGLVERVAVLPGHPVEPNDVLVELSSPQLAYDLEDALWEFESAEAEEQLRRAQAADRLLDLRASVAIAEAEYTTANLESEVKTALGESQIVSALEIQQAQIRAEQLLERLQAERAKLERYPETRAAEDAAAEAGLAQKRQRVRRLEEQVGDLNVRAGVTGIVQEVNVEVGERVAAGTDIARIVNPELLIARVRISERDVARVLVGQAVRLDHVVNAGLGSPRHHGIKEPVRSAVGQFPFGEPEPQPVVPVVREREVACHLLPGHTARRVRVRGQADFLFHASHDPGPSTARACAVCSGVTQ